MGVQTILSFIVSRNKKVDSPDIVWEWWMFLCSLTKEQFVGIRIGWFSLSSLLSHFNTFILTFHHSQQTRRCNFETILIGRKSLVHTCHHNTSSSLSISSIFIFSAVSVIDARAQTWIVVLFWINRYLEWKHPDWLLTQGFHCWEPSRSFSPPNERVTLNDIQAPVDAGILSDQLPINRPSHTPPFFISITNYVWMSIIVWWLFLSFLCLLLKLFWHFIPPNPFHPLILVSFHNTQHTHKVHFSIFPPLLSLRVEWHDVVLIKRPSHTNSHFWKNYGTEAKRKDMKGMR